MVTSTGEIKMAAHILEPYLRTAKYIYHPVDEQSRWVAVRFQVETDLMMTTKSQEIKRFWPRWVSQRDIYIAYGLTIANSETWYRIDNNYNEWKLWLNVIRIVDVNVIHIINIHMSMKWYERDNLIIFIILTPISFILI